MARLTIIPVSGAEQSIEAQDGLTVMEIIKNSGVGDLLALCGGGCSCATCHVYVDPDSLPKLPAMSADEQDLLGSLESKRDNSRLSCQLRLDACLDGMRVEIAPPED